MMAGCQLLDSADKDKTFSGLSIDSRTVNSGELFVAIKGEVHDGHRFLSNAIQKNVAGILAESNHESLKELKINVPLITADDTHMAMLELARNYRNSLSSACKIAAITGSNGKTTTKEFAYSLIETLENNRYRSPGNFNNLYGVPLALFKMPQRTKAAFFELGISTTEEMPRLAKFLQPNFVLLTNIGAAHLEFFETIENVAKAKLQLVANSSSNSKIIINGDDNLLVSETKKLRDDFITFGIKNRSDFMPENVEIIGKTQIVTIDGNKFTIPYIGEHHLYNFVAAYALVSTMGYSFDSSEENQIKVSTEEMRGEILTIGSVEIMADCYNANRESFISGLEAFFSVASDKKRVLVLGDMLELGSESSKMHYEIGHLLGKYEFDTCYLIGSEIEQMCKGALDAGVASDKFDLFPNIEDALEKISSNFENKFIFLKGSRGIGLEKLIDRLKSKEDAN